MWEASRELSDELKELSGWEFDQVQGYSLPMLLRKLPEKQRFDKHQSPLSLEYKFGDTWAAQYEQYAWGSADTPEDAACKLAIELFKQGVLK